MNDSIILEYFVMLLIGFNLSALIKEIYLLYYSKKAALYLQKIYNIILEHGDTNPASNLSTTDLPAVVNLIRFIYIEMFITFSVLAVTLITLLFTMNPILQASTAWWFVVYVTSFGTAYIVLTTRANQGLITNIDIICSSYDIILESYNHIDEYKED